MIGRFVSIKFWAIKWLFLVCLTGVSQQKLDTVKTIELTEKFEGLNVDNLGNVYVFDTQNILKLNENGQRFSFNFNGVDQISRLDCTNPYRLAIWDNVQQKIWLMDNTLSFIEQKPIELSDMQMYGTTAFCTAFSGQFLWFFDSQSQQIIKKNIRTFKTISTSNVFNQLQYDNLTVAQFSVNLNYLAILYNEGVLILDRFGGLFTNLPFICSKIWLDENNQIYFLKDKKIHRYSLKEMKQSTLFDCVVSPEKIDFKNNNWWILNDKNIYKIKIK